MKLQVNDIKKGMTIFFNESSQKNDSTKFKKATVVDVYPHHILIMVDPISARGVSSHTECLNKASIICNDVNVKDQILESEAATEEDVEAELL